MWERDVFYIVRVDKLSGWWYVDCETDVCSLEKNMCHGPAFTENNNSGALEVTSLVSAKCAVKQEPGDDLTQLACKVWLQHILGFYLAPHKSTCCCVQWAVAQSGVLTTEIKFCGFSAVQIFKWRKAYLKGLYEKGDVFTFLTRDRKRKYDYWSETAKERWWPPAETLCYAQNV